MSFSLLKLAQKYFRGQFAADRHPLKLEHVWKQQEVDCLVLAQVLSRILMSASRS